MRIANETKLSDGRKLLAWWANNSGRGKNNCSLAVVPADVARAPRAADQTGVITRTRTSSWAGDVNLSRRVLTELGLAESFNPVEWERKL